MANCSREARAPSRAGRQLPWLAAARSRAGSATSAAASLGPSSQAFLEMKCRAGGVREVGSCCRSLLRALPAAAAGALVVGWLPAPGSRGGCGALSLPAGGAGRGMLKADALGYGQSPLLLFLLRARARVPSTRWGVRCPCLGLAWAGLPHVCFN